jgi:hypothetical protein
MLDPYEQHIRALQVAQFHAYAQQVIAKSAVWMMFPLSPTCDVTILMDGKPDAAAIRHMIRVLEVCAQSYDHPATEALVDASPAPPPEGAPGE